MAADGKDLGGDILERTTCQEAGSGAVRRVRSRHAFAQRLEAAAVVDHEVVENSMGERGPRLAHARKERDHALPCSSGDRHTNT